MHQADLENLSGNVPEHFRKNAGNVPENLSGNVPELFWGLDIFRKCSGKFPDVFPEISGKS